MNDSMGQKKQSIFDTFKSLQFGIVVLISIVAVSIVGTIIPQGHPPEFYKEHYNGVVNFLIEVLRFNSTFGSPLFIGLLVLFGINLFLCSVSRFPTLLKLAFVPDKNLSYEKIKEMPVCTLLKGTTLNKIQDAFSSSGMKLNKIDETRLFGEKFTAGYFGAAFVHISLLVLLIGGLVSLLTTKKGYLVLENGQKTGNYSLYGGGSEPLGFEVELSDFKVDFYDKFPDRPKSFMSSVVITSPGTSAFNKEIKVNHPLNYKGLIIYQASYGLSHNSTVSASADTAIVDIRLKNAPENLPPLGVLEMVPGNEYSVPGFGDSLKIHLSELYSDFKRIQTADSQKNPALKIDVVINGETRWSVYAFKNFPGLNMPVENDIYFIFDMLDYKGSKGSESPGYYTVLGVSKDSGAPVMWAGSLLMIFGLFLSFYIRPKRVWILNENGKIILGASTRGDSAQLEEYIKKVMSRLLPGESGESI
jgi:cytochrome c biogenesis protein